jgi:phosphoribosylamine--glycine ligase
LPNNNDLTVMIVDHGGRAHALSSAYERSKRVNSIIVVPGNDFISYRRKKEVLCINEINESNTEEIIRLAKKYKVDLVDVAERDALALGTVDRLKEENINVFGPVKDSARIETDKVWSRNFMKRWNIPIPKYDTFSDEQLAIEYAKGIYRYDSGKVLYIKTAGICPGNSVLKAENFEQAVSAIKKMKSYGNAAASFLIEEGIEGEEISITAITDGKDYRILKTAHNEKNLRNFDKGPITRGVGACSPVLRMEYDSSLIRDEGDSLKETIERKIIRKTINGLKSEGYPFVGILTAVVMLVNDGGKITPKVVEFNARFGDPEAEVLLPGIQTDYVDIVDACIGGKLKDTPIKEDKDCRLCVAGCARGYPGDIAEAKGKMIFGIEKALNFPGVEVFGAHIELNNEHFYVGVGGRLFHIVASGKDILEARTKAYAAISMINIEGNNLHYRTDIAWEDVDLVHMQDL